jgi:hypothetical protein
MKITIVSKWYNEELLAPLFLKHYGYVDEIRILLETDTNDRTREICSSYPNVKIIDVHNSRGYDEVENLEIINQALSEVKEGWIYAALADEFIFPEWNEDPRKFLARQTSNPDADVVWACMFHVFKHHTEGPIDYDKEVIPQRIHGRSIERNRDYFTKPIVFRASAKAVVGYGLHKLRGVYSYSNERYIGSHWKWADKEIAVRRRISNRDTFSPRNIRRNLGSHDFHVTEESIVKELEDGSDFPELGILTARKNEDSHIDR